MQYKVTAPATVKGEIKLPSSKSISNRVLIINALSYSPFPVANLSDSDDTKVMQEVLYSNTNKFNIGHAGTAMRFLTAYLSKIVGEWELTGSLRMKERPIAILVDALHQLGARIEYIEKEGYPPLRIFGSHLKGSTIELDGSVSSQYITALLLIAPCLENGLTLSLKNKITSRSYIGLTLNLMAKFGIKHQWDGNKIRIEEQTYLPVDYSVEGDWSGASYWYQIMAIANNSEVNINGLQLPSLQGDAIIAKWFGPFGVKSTSTNKGITLSNNPVELPQHITLDFIENPDVAQTMAAFCVAKKIPFLFTGLETLKIKETNRIKALQDELLKFGAVISEPKHGELMWDGTIHQEKIQKEAIIKTYNDHRMAMAFAPMSLNGKPVIIDDPMVVTKSYPAFWDDLKACGFSVQEL